MHFVVWIREGSAGTRVAATRKCEGLVGHQRPGAGPNLPLQARPDKRRMGADSTRSIGTRASGRQETSVEKDNTGMGHLFCHEVCPWPGCRKTRGDEIPEAGLLK